MNREIYNTVLIHTARAWERVRLEQPNEEMPYDSDTYIESRTVDLIKKEILN